MKEIQELLNSKALMKQEVAKRTNEVFSNLKTLIVQSIDGLLPFRKDERVRLSQRNKGRTRNTSIDWK